MPINPESKGYGNWAREAWKIQQKPMGMKDQNGPRMAKGIKRAKDAKRNKIGQESPKKYENKPSSSTGLHDH